MNWLAVLSRGSFAASAAALGWLLLHPPAAGLLGPSPAGDRPLPSLGPVTALVDAGRAGEAIGELAALVRAAPALADKRGALEASPALRELVLTRWKEAVEQAPEPEEALRDVRFLQRRLAGGCS